MDHDLVICVETGAFAVIESSIYRQIELKLAELIFSMMEKCSDFTLSISKRYVNA